MTWQSVLVGLVVGITVLALVGCGSSKSMRYKMVVEVDTPAGLRTGAAVREIRFIKPSNLPSIGESRPHWRVNGEAVAVDLPDGRMLFALLVDRDGSPNHADRTIWLMFHDLGATPGDGEIELWPRALHPNPAGAVDPLPMLVTLQDLTAPRSVEKVDPANLAPQFGTGVKLRRVWVQRTNEDLTTGIEERLGWLKTHSGSLDFTGRLHAANPEKDITPSAFVKRQAR